MNGFDPWRLKVGDPEIPGVLSLIRESFAYMAGRIDPPSSMERLTVDAVSRQCDTGEVWAIGTPPVACVFFEWRQECLYLGKLAVANHARGQEHSRRLVALAESRAQKRGLRWLELQTRVELAENHAIFTKMGFAETGRSAHPGFRQPTSITFRKRLVA